ncbi:Synaptic vesicle 2-related protein [Trichoplax sp. H2]|nr:Synaptic vesicle 2-related protein [Trichoplax sp. H2]|eukprot:RDD44737.1 Synaptic vesicle 2-related protein [Trichoplax sp. H2]
MASLNLTGEIFASNSEHSIDNHSVLGDQLDCDQDRTVEDCINSIGFGKYQIRLLLLAGCDTLVDAMEVMLLAIIGPVLLCEWSLSPWQEAFMTTFVFIGIGIGALFWGWICDIYGRKLGVLSAAILTFYYGFLCSFSPSYFWIICTRALTGFSLSGSTQMVTILSEFLPTPIRARAVIFLSVFWSTGVTLEVLLAYAIMPHLGWRQYAKAVATLQNAARVNGKPILQGTIKQPTKMNYGRLRNLLMPPYRKTTLLLWTIWFCTGFTYYGIILIAPLVYSTDHCGANSLVQSKCDCKVLTTADYGQLLITTLAEFLGTFLSFALIERLGRKKLLALECLISAVLFFVLIVCNMTIAMLVGEYQVITLYTPEIYPTSSRASGLGFCSGFSRLSAMVTPFIAQIVFTKTKALALSIYGLVSLLSAACSIMLPIETKGRTMQESDWAQTIPVQ